VPLQAADAKATVQGDLKGTIVKERAIASALERTKTAFQPELMSARDLSIY